MNDSAKFGALGSVLARDLASIEDLPSYIAPPPGVYKLLVKNCGPKEINNKSAVVVEYVVLECVALHEPENTEDIGDLAKVKFGKDMVGETFWFNQPDKLETTLSFMKKQFAGLGETLGKTDLLSILDAIPNMTVKATLSQRVDENDKTKIYPQIRNLIAAV